MEDKECSVFASIKKQIADINIPCRLSLFWLEPCQVIFIMQLLNEAPMGLVVQADVQIIYISKCNMLFGHSLHCCVVPLYAMNIRSPCSTIPSLLFN